MEVMHMNIAITVIMVLAIVVVLLLFKLKSYHDQFGTGKYWIEYTPGNSVDLMKLIHVINGHEVEKMSEMVNDIYDYGFQLDTEDQFVECNELVISKIALQNIDQDDLWVVESVERICDKRMMDMMTKHLPVKKS
jgi:hypothetical protein